MIGVRVQTIWGRGTITKIIRRGYYLTKMDNGNVIFVPEENIIKTIAGTQSAAALAYANASETFHGYDIQKYANKTLREWQYKKTNCFVDTFMRSLRDLRQQGLINYEVINRQKSKFRKI